MLYLILHAFGAHATRNTGMITALCISSNKQHSHVMVNLTIGEESNFDFIHYVVPCRHDMSKPKRHYWEKPIARDISGFAEWARQNEFACAHPPLLNPA